MMNFPNGFSDPCGMQMNNYGMGMGNYGMGMMGAQYPEFTPQIIGRPAPLAAYTSRTKDDTAVKVAGLGALAIVVGALLLRGKGLKGLLKSSKNVDNVAKTAAESNTATATAAKATVESATSTAKTATESAAGLASATSKKTAVNSAAMKKIEANVKRDMAKNPQVSSANNPIILPERMPRPVSNAVLNKVEANVKRDMAKNPQVSSDKNPILLPERLPRQAAAANSATAEIVEATVIKDVASTPQVVATQITQAVTAQAPTSSSVVNLATKSEPTVKATQAVSTSKPAVDEAVAKTAQAVEITDFAVRETKSEAIIKQGNKGNLTNAQRRNAELNYATEIKNGKHIEPAITEAERIKYSAGVAYSAPVGTQAKALAKNNSAADKAKASASQIGNNISQSTYEKLMQIGR